MGFIKYLRKNDTDYLNEYFDMCKELIKTSSANKKDLNDSLDFLEDAREYILNSNSVVKDRADATDHLISLVKKKLGELKIITDKLNSLRASDAEPDGTLPEEGSKTMAELHNGLVIISKVMTDFYDSNLYALRKQRPMEVDFYVEDGPICPSCERKISYHESFCSHCGQALMR